VANAPKKSAFPPARVGLMIMVGGLVAIVALGGLFS